MFVVFHFNFKKHFKIVLGNRGQNQEPAAWRRFTLNNWMKTMGHTDFIASNRRIAGVAGETWAVWWMIGHITFGVGPTDTGAWITAFIIHAGFRFRTIIVIDTFGPAFRIWIAVIIWQTTAWASIISFSAYCIYTARWWTTWLAYFGFTLNYCKLRFVNSVIW